jgi:hypothetical protein
MGDVVKLRPEYSAKAVHFKTDDGYIVRMSGTLEGALDFCIETASGPLTYVLTPDDAHRIIAGLYAVCADIRENCLFDRDPRLYDERTSTMTIVTIQIDARRNTCQQVRDDMQDVALQSEHAKVEDWREITPESAVEIASWWGDDTPGAVGFVLDGFAGGEEVEVAALLSDIELTRATHPCMDVFDVNALDYLMTFVTQQH